MKFLFKEEKKTPWIWAVNKKRKKIEKLAVSWEIIFINVKIFIKKGVKIYIYIIVF